MRRAQPAGCRRQRDRHQHRPGNAIRRELHPVCRDGHLFPVAGVGVTEFGVRNVMIADSARCLRLRRPRPVLGPARRVGSGHTFDARPHPAERDNRQGSQHAIGSLMLAPVCRAAYFWPTTVFPTPWLARHVLRRRSADHADLCAALLRSPYPQAAAQAARHATSGTATFMLMVFTIALYAFVLPPLLGALLSPFGSSYVLSATVFAPANWHARRHCPPPA